VALLLPTAGYAFFYSLNTPVAYGKIEGKVIRLAPLTSQYSVGTAGFIELGDGRVVNVIYRSGAKIPEPGATVTVTRITMRLMGERFRAD
jgi:hypothetical protein